MRILIDECVPRQIKSLLVEHTCATVQEMKWDGFTNGDLLVRAEGEFQLFITADKNLAYQQNIMHRNLIIVELSTNDWRRIRTSARVLQDRINRCSSGEYVRVEIE